MQMILLRTNTTNQSEGLKSHIKIEERNNSQQNRSSKFSSRTCVALAAACSAVSIIGTLYYLTISQSNVPKSSLSERLGAPVNAPICINADQFTSVTGIPAPNKSDAYCIYTDQTLPSQMTDLVNHGIISIIKEAGNMIYHGAINTFACINNGLTWRQYSDESVCVFMDPETCHSLAGYADRGGSNCSPVIDLEIPPVKRFCTKDLAPLCKWFSQETVGLAGSLPD